MSELVHSTLLSSPYFFSLEMHFFVLLSPLYPHPCCIYEAVKADVSYRRRRRRKACANIGEQEKKNHCFFLARLIRISLFNKECNSREESKKIKIKDPDLEKGREEESAGGKTEPKLYNSIGRRRMLLLLLFVSFGSAVLSAFPSLFYFRFCGGKRKERKWDPLRCIREEATLP